MFAVQTKKELQPFCYERLTAMMPYDEAAVTYVCPVWDCLVNYTSSGYFIAAKKGDMVEQSTTPSIRCPNDGMPMYLGSGYSGDGPRWVGTIFVESLFLLR